MTRFEQGAAIASRPTAGKWEYGGYPYGLEPLALPVPGTARDETVAGDDDLVELSRQIFDVCTSGDAPVAAADEAELAWFRWITGHQVSFVLWALMARLMSRYERRCIERQAVVHALRDHVLGHCAMLAYAGSCSRQVYEATIRPSMWRQHRAFSGSWAPDFVLVRDLLRGHHSARLDGARGSLSRAIALHHAIHSAVASKLVPGGHSLLQAAHLPEPDRSLTDGLYDSFFLTVRSPTPFTAVLVQLFRRLVAIAQDVSANGFVFDPESSWHVKSGPLWQSASGCERDFPEMLTTLAVAAATCHADRSAVGLDADMALLPPELEVPRA